MAYEKINTDKKFFKYSQCKKGDVLVENAKYLGKTPNKFGKDNFEFQEKEGTIKCLNHSGHLAFLVDKYMSVGDWCRIVYAGTSKLERGTFAGKEVHNFELYKENSTEAKPAMQNSDEISLKDLE